MFGINLNGLIIQALTVSVCILHLYIELVAGKQCLKNEVLGEVDGNTYQCNDPDKQECCEEDKEFTCCQAGSTRNIIEQVQLWGIVSAIAIIIVVLLFCLCKDVNYCASDKSVKAKFQDIFCRNRNKPSNVNTNVTDNEYDDIPSGPSCSPVISLSSTEMSSRPTTGEKM